MIHRKVKAGTGAAAIVPAIALILAACGFPVPAEVVSAVVVCVVFVAGYLTSSEKATV